MVLAKAEALRAGCLDAVLLTTSGFVAGCTEGHLFAVNDGIIRTPPGDGGYPLDVTLAVVFGLAKAQNVPVFEAALTPTELFTADELFMAGVGGGVIGVVRVDDRPIGPGREGPMTAAIRQGYRSLTRGE